MVRLIALVLYGVFIATGSWVVYEKQNAPPLEDSIPLHACPPEKICEPVFDYNGPPP